MNATCPHCDTTFRRVDRDEDGAPSIPARKCALDTCEVWLCEAVCREHLSFVCECGSRFCNEHMTVIDDLKLCPDCVIEACRIERAPACTCQRIDVDLDDASGCEVHGEAA